MNIFIQASVLSTIGIVIALLSNKKFSMFRTCVILLSLFLLLLVYMIASFHIKE